MNRVFILAIIPLLLFHSCMEKISLKRINSERIEINDSLKAKEQIKSFIAPYRQHIDSSLNAVLCYSPNLHSKKDGDLNTAIGNMMADAVFELSAPIFNHRTGKTLDFVLLNHGGIRSIIPKGDISTRTAYQIMPFENEVVVVGLRGFQVQKLLDYLRSAKRAHPISKNLQIVIDDKNEILSATVNGNKIVNDSIYYVGTSDYLYNGGDRMDFYRNNEDYVELDYKIRNVLIDYFAITDTLNIEKDERFIRK